MKTTDLLGFEIEKNIENKNKIEKIISEVLETDHIHSYYFTEISNILENLTEYARENDILVTLRTEHSNFAQGLLIHLVKKEFADKFIKYL